MTDDAKEWVTIKIPTDVRDDAREDPRTYGEVMRAGLDKDADAAPDGIELGEGHEVIVDRIAEGLDGVDEDAIADAVAGRAVSLEASERRAIAEEVVGMLR